MTRKRIIPEDEYKRLQRLEAREAKMKPLILQLASYMQNRKIKGETRGAHTQNR